MDAATKAGLDAAKNASKIVVQNTAEATGDLIGNEIVASTLGQSVHLQYKGDSRCEFESTGFPSQIAVTKMLESNHHVNKKKLNVTSINQMVIR